MSVDLKDVLPAIVVQIDEFNAPPYILRIRR